MDVEGHEVESVPEWVSSGVLADVDQIGIEFHVTRSISRWGVRAGEDVAAVFVRMVRALYALGFRVIEWHHVVWSGMTERKQFPVFEVVFKKNNSGICHGFVT